VSCGSKPVAEAGDSSGTQRKEGKAAVGSRYRAADSEQMTVDARGSIVG
jgi:hypothetical protein